MKFMTVIVSTKIENTQFKMMLSLPFLLLVVPRMKCSDQSSERQFQDYFTSCRTEQNHRS